MKPAFAEAVAREVARIYLRRGLPAIRLRHSATQRTSSGHCAYGERRVFERTATGRGGPRCRSTRKPDQATRLYLHPSCWRRATEPGSFERARIVVTCGTDHDDATATLLHELAHALTPGAWHGIAFLRKNRELFALFGMEQERSEYKSKRAARTLDREARG